MPEYRPKHVGENITNTIYKKYWSVFFGYLYIPGSDLCMEDGKY